MIGVVMFKDGHSEEILSVEELNDSQILVTTPSGKYSRTVNTNTDGVLTYIRIRYGKYFATSDAGDDLYEIIDYIQSMLFSDKEEGECE